MKFYKTQIVVATICFLASSYSISAADNKEQPSKSTVTNSDQANKRPKLEPKIREALKKILSTSHEGLKEENAKSGKKINLQGRFKHAPVAIINEDGESVITEYSSIPEQE